MRLMRRLALAATAMTTLALVGACGSAQPTVSDVAAQPGISDELVAAAQDEGEVVVYHTPGNEVTREWVQGFTEEYGIEVTTLRQGSNALMERFNQEARAGQNLADVIYKSDPADLVEAEEQGLLANYTTGNAEFFDDGSPGYFYPIYTIRYPLAYNSDLLSAEELELIETEGAEALTDPRFRGQIATTNVNVSNTIASFYYSMAERQQEQYGWDWVEGVAANEPTIYDSSSPMADRLVAGEFAIAFPFPDTFIAPMMEAGAPIRWFYAEETVAGSVYAAIANEAPHPNAARLFMEWATSPEAITEVSRLTQGEPTHSDAEDVRTLRDRPWYEPPGELWVDWYDDPEFLGDQEEFNARMADVFQYTS